jgi:hypothetical protein
MFSNDSRRFERSLAETVAWCSALSLGVDHTNTSAILHRRALLDRSKQLFEEGRTHANERWFGKKACDTEQWRQAGSLIQQVRNLLGPMKYRTRTAALKPNFDLDEFGVNAPWSEAVEDLVIKRSKLIEQNPSQGATGNAADGRLLLYVPSENLADGAAEFSSNGFFDVNNVPPWDIWVDFSNGTLTSWVPPMLLDAAEMGIDANPEECIRWAD